MDDELEQALDKISLSIIIRKFENRLEWFSEHTKLINNIDGM
jgi:hypothetical protein